MRNDLVKLHAEALAAQNSGNFYEAVRIWELILQQQPNWEHGIPHYLLADCLERIGELERAEQALRDAVNLSPGCSMFEEGLRSHLAAKKSGILPL
jgi:Flp pilus assembly protein TadD